MLIKKTGAQSAKTNAPKHDTPAQTGTKKDNRKKAVTQEDIVLRHLKRKSITSMEAFELYKITRLSAKIFNLRADGYNIITKRETNPTTGATYGKYILRDKVKKSV